MPLKEYKSGITFPGVIERTVDQSEPAWRNPYELKRMHLMYCSLCWTTQDLDKLGAMAALSTHPIWIARLLMVLLTAICILLLCALLAVRACLPAETTIRTTWPASPKAQPVIQDITGILPFENGFLSETLLEQGYNTYAIGKWHLTPADQISAAGPYDRWPLGRGFERFDGFLGAETNQYYPELIYDNHSIDPPKTPEEGYTLNEDIVDRAIQFIADSKQVTPSKPFFMYFCPGAMHAPHHVPKEWADKYKGQFDGGWETYRERTFSRQKELGIIPKETELSRHDPDVKPWDQCSPEEKKLYASMMEVFAGFLEHTDYHIGRLLQFLKDIGEFKNTLIMVISDN